jgi:membrane protein implicated in regulation of membrane protease activity
MPWIDQPSHRGDDRPGCMDAIVLTRMAFGILFWPMLAVIAAAAGVTLAILLLASYPLPTIAGAIALAVAAIALTQWISGRRRPPGA